MLAKVNCEGGEDNPNNRNLFGGRGSDVNGILRIVILTFWLKQVPLCSKERVSITTTAYALSAPDHPHINSTMDLLIDDNGGFPGGSW